MSIATDIEGFLAGVEAIPDLWQAIDCRLVALRMDDAWHNIAGVFRLDYREPVKVHGPAHLPQTRHLLAVREVRPISELRALIDEVASGTLRIGGHKVCLFHGGTTDAQTAYRSSGHVHAGRHDDLRDEVHQVAHRLTLSGESNHEFFSRLPRHSEQLSVELRQLSQPWPSLNALTLRGLGTVQRIAYDSSRIVSFVAPIPISLVEDQCKLRDGILTYQIRVATKRVVAEASLGIFGSGRDGTIISDSLPLAARQWKKGPHGYELTGRYPFRKVEHASVMLQVSGQSIEHLSFRNTSGVEPALLTASRALCAEVRDFERFLLDPETNSKEFERAFSRLLTLCGLLVDPVGEVPKNSNSVDVVATAPGTRSIYLFECTTGSLSKEGKLGNLIDRTAQARRALSDTHPEFVVVPLMVCSRSFAEGSTAETELAHADDVRILWRGDLEQLYFMAIEGPTLEDVLDIVDPDHPSPLASHSRNPLARFPRGKTARRPRNLKLG